MLETIGDEIQRLCRYVASFKEEKLHDIVLGAFYHLLSFLTIASEAFTANSSYEY